MGGVDGFLPSKASSFCAIEEEARPRLPDAGAFFIALKIPDDVGGFLVTKIGWF